jgi:hypothetical protein
MECLNKVWEVLINDFIIKGLLITVIIGSAITYLNENLKVLRTSFLIASAKRKLKTAKAETIKHGVDMLVEIAIDRPYRRQEMLDIIVQECFRDKFNRTHDNPPITPPDMVNVFLYSLKAILNIPRENENHHSLNIDLHKIVLVEEEGKSIYLQKMNFKDVVLWGSEFINVDFSRSDFENSDLGGVRFVGCGLEDLNLKNARLSYSYLDPKRPTMIINSHATRSRIDEALILTGKNQLLIVNTEIDPEQCEKLMNNTPAVKIECKKNNGHYE